MPTRLPSVTTEAEADMKIMRTALGLILCTLITSGVAADECVSGIGDYPYFPPERAEHFEYNLSTGYQVLIPHYTFNCYGKILEWSALTVYREISGFFSPHHVAYFQVWRPTGVGRYARVGYDRISVHNNDIQPSYTSTTPGVGLAFYNITSVVEDRGEDDEEGEDNSPLYFQPGDILGFFIRSGQLRWPLSVTYREPLAGDPESLVVDMFYTTTLEKSDDMQLCEMSECAENVIKIASVIPHIYFTYEPVLADEVPQQPSNEHCYNSSVDQIECPVPSSSSSLFLTPTPVSTPSSPPPVPTTSDPSTGGMQFLLIGVVVAAGAIVVTLACSICVVVMCVVVRKRRALKSDEKPHLQATNYHYQTVNGALYSEPSTTYRTGSSRSTDAYASTYQTRGGENHMYQELENPSLLNLQPAPHFALHTGHDSVRSLTSAPPHPSLPHNFTPGPVPWAASAQGPSDFRGGGSLRQVATLPPRPIPRPPMTSMPAMAVDHHRRSSVPGGPHQGSKRPPLPQNPPFSSEPTGKSLPALPSSPPTSPPPLPSPPTPEMTDAPVAYSSPHKPAPKPWYQSDYEPSMVKARPYEEGFLVPTMEERESLGGEDIYFRLRRPHSKRQSGDVSFFEESDHFWEPAPSTAGLYQQLASRNFREIHRKYVHVKKRLGSGHFATVHKGTWKCPKGEVEVAIKRLQKGASDDDRVSFLQEAAIMGQFSHPNVVPLHGVVTVGEPIMIVLELMPNGDLKNYLTSFTKRPRSPSSPRPSPSIPPTLPNQLLSFCRQIACGMNYLSNKGFIHRDLAARNIFLTEDYTCKIGDFGLARDLGKDDIYHSRGGKIPIMWTAPEALNYRQYSTGSDVWSYGMVLFEIWSLGHKPFHDLTEKAVMELMDNCHCQCPPPGCPKPLYELMTQCWNPKPTERPTFSSIGDYLKGPDDVLLALPDPSPSLSPLALQLGAPLAEAKGLYLDLQYSYDESVV